MPVIYIDILFVVNFFITLMLLFITSKLIKKEPLLWRTLCGAAIGGVYSLSILVPDISFLISYFGKVIFALLMVLVTYGFHSLKRYLKTVLIFFFSNLAFLGVIVGIWFIFKPTGVVINNSVVYFDVSAKVLLITAFIAYIISVSVIKIHNHFTAKRDVYDLIIGFNDKVVHLYALSDSGNNLREPFSDYPVIIARKSLFENAPVERVIPYNTVSGEGVLTAFKPDYVEVKSSGNSITVNKVYVALSDNIASDEFSAIISPKIINI